LDSQHALVIPLGRVKLKVAVVPGQTPFLISNTLIRALKAQIDADQQVLKSPMLKQSVDLHLTPKGLFLIDINQLALQANDRIKVPVHDTFVSQDRPMEVKNDEADPIVKEQLLVEKSLKETGSQAGSCSLGSPMTDSYISHDKPRHVHSESSKDKSRACDSSHLNVRHDVFGGSPEEASRSQQRAGGGLQSSIDPGTRGISCGLWQHSSRQEIHRDVEQPPKLDSVLHKPLPGEQEAQSPQDDCLHYSQGREVRAGRNASPSYRSYHIDQDEVNAQGESQAESRGIQARSQCLDGRVESGRSQLGGSGPRDGSGGRLRRDQGGVGCYADSNAAHGERDSDDLATCERNQHYDSRQVIDASTEWHWLNAGDHDALDQGFSEVFPLFISNYEKSDRNRFHQLVSQYTEELRAVIDGLTGSKTQQNALLFEVFCSRDSQLAKQCLQLGSHAERFGYKQGDLHTKAGRSNLFMKLCHQKPRNVWYSPMCGPWCAFSALNGSRSPEAFQELQEHRHHHVADLALGLVLLRFQASQGNHFHWEQPARSAMFRSPLMKELFEKTQCAQFDLCQVGHLCDPQSNKFVKKGLEVLTTSIKLYQDLHGNTCPGNHEHQRIEGTIRIGEETISRTKWSENYPRKFARR